MRSRSDSCLRAPTDIACTTSAQENSRLSNREWPRHGLPLRDRRAHPYILRAARRHRKANRQNKGQRSRRPTSTSASNSRAVAASGTSNKPYRVICAKTSPKTSALKIWDRSTSSPQASKAAASKPLALSRVKNRRLSRYWRSTNPLSQIAPQHSKKRSRKSRFSG